MAPKSKAKKEEPISPKAALASALPSLLAAEGAAAKSLTLDPLLSAIAADPHAISLLMEDEESVEALVGELVGMVREVAGDIKGASPEALAALDPAVSILRSLIQGSGKACRLFERSQGLALALSSLIPPPPQPSPVEEESSDPAPAPAPAPAPDTEEPSSPTPNSWDRSELSDSLATLIEKMADLVASAACYPEARALLRDRGTLPLLIALLAGPFAPYSSLLASAALAFSRLVESTLARSSLALPSHLPSLLLLVAQLASSASLTNIPLLRCHSKLFWSLGFCLYDGKLRSALLESSLIEHAINALSPTPERKGEAGEVSVDLQKALGELQANAAIVLAIGAQTVEGRTAVLDVPSSVRLLIGSLQLPLPDDRAVESDPLLANASLAIAHLAISTRAALELIEAGAVRALIPLLAQTPAGAEQVSPVRGNACTALLHLCNSPSGRAALLEGEGLAYLAAIVATPNSDPSLSTTAIDVMSQIAEEKQGRMAVLSSGVVPSLLPLISLDYAKPLIEATAALLSSVALTSAGCALLRGEVEANNEEPADPPPPPPTNALKCIPALLGPQSAPQLRRAAAGLVISACEQRENANQLLALGCVSTLISLSKEHTSGYSSSAAAAVDAVCRALPAVQLWHRAELSTLDSIEDGFVAVTRDCTLQTLDQMRESRAGTSEVLLVDATIDTAFAADVEKAQDLAHKCRQAEGGPAEVAASLAKLVCERLGGCIHYDRYQLVDFSGEISRLMTARASKVLPIGDLRRGVARHRALLYKALADRVGLAVGLHMGKCLRGAHAHHSWNSMVSEGKVLVVDVLHSPGMLYEEGTDAALKYKRENQYAFSSLTSTNHAFNQPNNVALTVT